MAIVIKEITRKFGDIFTGSWAPEHGPVQLVNRSASPFGAGATFLGGHSYPQVTARIDTSVAPALATDWLQNLRFYWTVFVATPNPGTVPFPPPIGTNAEIVWQQLMTPKQLTFVNDANAIHVQWDLGPAGLTTESHRRDVVSTNNPEFCSAVELVDYRKTLWPTVHPGASVGVTTLDIAVWGQNG